MTGNTIHDNGDDNERRMREIARRYFTYGKALANDLKLTSDLALYITRSRSLPDPLEGGVGSRAEIDTPEATRPSSGIKQVRIDYRQISVHEGNVPVVRLQPITEWPVMAVYATPNHRGAYIVMINELNVLLHELPDGSHTIAAANAVSMAPDMPARSRAFEHFVADPRSYPTATSYADAITQARSDIALPLNLFDRAIRDCANTYGFVAPS